MEIMEGGVRLDFYFNNCWREILDKYRLVEMRYKDQVIETFRANFTDNSVQGATSGAIIWVDMHLQDYVESPVKEGIKIEEESLSTEKLIVPPAIHELCRYENDVEIKMVAHLTSTKELFVSCPTKSYLYIPIKFDELNKLKIVFGKNVTEFKDIEKFVKDNLDTMVKSNRLIIE